MSLPDKMSFGDMEARYHEYDQASVVILPVPFDLTCSYQKGAAKGPMALLESSYYLEMYDLETRTEVYRNGVHVLPAVEAADSETMVERVYQEVAVQIKAGKYCAVLGGEHSVSIGSIKAHQEKYPGLGVLQLDAHTDRRDEYEGSKLSHACAMARVSEFGVGIVSAGIRAVAKEEISRLNSDDVFLAEDIQDSPDWQQRVIDRLPRDVYLTFDLDSLDPSIMPSTGTPEPGGLLWYPTLKLLKKLFAQRNVVGFDIVELCPMNNKEAEFLAAKLFYKILTYKFLKEG